MPNILFYDKKILFYSILFVFVACSKTNNNNNNPISSTFSFTAYLQGNQTNDFILIGKDTATITVNITSSSTTSSYTITANDTIFYNSNRPILANQPIVASKPAGTYIVKYTSNTANSNKVLTFTVTNNSGVRMQQSLTFNVRAGFVARVYPTNPNLLFGNSDSLVVQIRATTNIGTYSISFSNDTVYKANTQYKPDSTVPLNINLSIGVNADTIIYIAVTNPLTAKNLPLSYTVKGPIGTPQTDTVKINLLNNSFTPVVKPFATDILLGTKDTVTIAITGIANTNATYSLQIDSAFIYKGNAYPKGSYIKLQNIKGNTGLDSIVFTGNVVGSFNPTLTIKNSLIDSTATTQNYNKLSLVVGNNIALTQPVNGATNVPVQPIFVWNNNNTFANIVSYSIYYGTSLNSLVQDIGNYTINRNTSDTIRISPDGGTTSPYLSYNTTYYWKVVGKDATGRAIDSATSSFTVRSAINLNTARYDFGLVNYNNTLYAIGGSSNGNIYMNPLNSVEISTNGTSWTTSSPLPTARAGLGVAVYNNQIYAIGGTNGSTLSTVDIWDATRWVTGAGDTLLPTARVKLGVAVYNNQIYAIGGYNGSILKTVDIWDSTRWIRGVGDTLLPKARVSLSLATNNGKLYAIGGENIYYYNNVDVWDGSNWKSGTPLPVAMSNIGVVVYNNKIYAIGGYNSNIGVFNNVYIWDGSSSNWASGTPMPTSRLGLGLAVLNNMIYAVGGIGPSTATITSIVEIYNPATNQWQ